MFGCQTHVPMFAGIKSGYPPTEMRTNICSGTHHGHATSQGCVLNAHHVQPPSHQRGRAESGDGGAQQAEQRVDDAKELPVSLQAHERRRIMLSIHRPRRYDWQLLEPRLCRSRTRSRETTSGLWQLRALDKPDFSALACDYRWPQNCSQKWTPTYTRQGSMDGEGTRPVVLEILHD